MFDIKIIKKIYKQMDLSQLERTKQQLDYQLRIIDDLIDEKLKKDNPYDN